MSQSNDILNLLNLKDPNIIFDDHCVSEEKVHGITAKIFHGRLTVKPDVCPHCHDGNIIRYGFEESRITLPSVSGFNAYLCLKKQRFYCRHCHHTFSIETPVVPKNCFISNNTRLAVTIGLKDKISEKDLAAKHNISTATVERVMDRAFESYKPGHNWLPEALCFDEFKSVKAAQGAMSFVYCNAETSEIIDIVEDRRLNHLINYFSGFTRKARRNVKYIVLDMYSPYMTLIKKLFPCARCIIDRFHIVQLVGRALNKTRIQVMKTDRKNQSKYKKFWRLFLKNASEVDAVHYIYQPTYRCHITSHQILEDLLEKSPELNNAYQIYQMILHTVRNRDIEAFDNMLKLASTGHISDAMKTAVQTLKQYKNFIYNSLTSPYSNGRIEGINNKIKVIKRIAFGYSSFNHFRCRILITQGILKIKTA